MKQMPVVVIIKRRTDCRPGLGEGDESFPASDKQTQLYVQVR